MRRTSMVYLLFTVWACVLCQLGAGCNRGDEWFDFGVTNLTGRYISSITIAFVGHGGTWPVGDINGGEPGVKGVGGIPGPIPDAADVSWTDASGSAHKQRVKIAPLPPPTETSYHGKGRCIYFVIQADGSARVMYHDPRFDR
jgi:hypothetical protein